MGQTTMKNIILIAARTGCCQIYFENIKTKTFQTLLTIITYFKDDAYLKENLLGTHFFYVLNLSLFLPTCAFG